MGVDATPTAGSGEAEVGDGGCKGVFLLRHTPVLMLLLSLSLTVRFHWRGFRRAPEGIGREGGGEGYHAGRGLWPGSSVFPHGEASAIKGTTAVGV